MRQLLVFSLILVFGITSCEEESVNKDTASNNTQSEGILTFESAPGLTVEVIEGSIPEGVTISASIYDWGLSTLFESEPISKAYVLEPHGVEFLHPLVINIPISGPPDDKTVVIVCESQASGCGLVNIVGYNDTHVSVYVNHFSIFEAVKSFTSNPSDYGLIDSGFDFDLDRFAILNTSEDFQDLGGANGACFGFVGFASWYFKNQKSYDGSLSQAITDSCAKQLITEAHGTINSGLLGSILFGLDYAGGLMTSDGWQATNLILGLKESSTPQVLLLQGGFGNVHSILVYKWDPPYFYAYDPNLDEPVKLEFSDGQFPATYKYSVNDYDKFTALTLTSLWLPIKFKDLWEKYKDCEEICVSDCNEKECGSDGCGGSCGSCNVEYKCKNGECVLEVFCGNGNCEDEEDCSNCEDDCGVCPITCGNNKCEKEKGEHCKNCSSDCDCDSSEVCLNNGICCKPDCYDEEYEIEKMCGNDGCGGSCGECPDGYKCSEDGVDCEVFCGNNKCDWPEDCENCSEDCSCNPKCGDDKCDINEDCETCEDDCGPCTGKFIVCGDEKCEGDEDSENCPEDCSSPCVDNDEDGYGKNCDLGEDCNDDNGKINPEEDEICDSKDNDCNGDIDEGNVCINCDDYQSSYYPNDGKCCTDGDDGELVCVIDFFDSPGIDTAGLAWDGNYLWYVDDAKAKIYKLDENCQVISSFSSPGVDPKGIAWDGGSLWNVDAKDDTIYQLTTGGEIVSSFLTPYPYLGSGLVWDGNYLWHVESQGTNVSSTKILKLTTDGQIVDSFNPPGSKKIAGLAWDGDYFWSTDLVDDRIYKLTISGQTVSFFDSPVNDPTGLAWGDDYLWCADSDEDKIYKLEIIE